MISPLPGDGEPSTIYRCRGCDSELFDVARQFEFGTGAWPNFTEPISAQAVVIDQRPPAAPGGHGVRCRRCGGHLGRLYSDGPGRGGSRYCVEWGLVRLGPG